MRVAFLSTVGREHVGPDIAEDVGVHIHGGCAFEYVGAVEAGPKSAGLDDQNSDTERCDLAGKRFDQPSRANLPAE